VRWANTDAAGAQIRLAALNAGHELRVEFRFIFQIGV
jgi:hypothetical protein